MVTGTTLNRLKGSIPIYRTISCIKVKALLIAGSLLLPAFSLSAECVIFGVVMSKMA